MQIRKRYLRCITTNKCLDVRELMDVLVRNQHGPTTPYWPVNRQCWERKPRWEKSTLVLLFLGFLVNMQRKSFLSRICKLYIIYVIILFTYIYIYIIYFYIILYIIIYYKNATIPCSFLQAVFRGLQSINCSRLKSCSNCSIMSSYF